MAESLRVNRGAWYGSLALHVLFALVFLVGVEALNPTPEAGSKTQVIQASLITDRAFAALIADLETGAANAPEVIEPPKPEFVPPPLPEPEPLKPDPAEAQRLAAELLAQEAAKRAAEVAAQREAEERAALKQAELEAQRLAEAQARAEEQARRQAERERQQAEAEQLAQKRAEAERERKRRQDAERRAAEQAAQLAAELERARQQQLAEEAAQMAVEEERRLAEDLLQEQLLAEASQLREEEKPVRANRASQGDTTTEKYKVMIGDYVAQYWIRPPELNDNIQYEAVVFVRLTKSGDVIDVKIIQSNGNPLFEQSVLAAIEKARRFPVPDGAAFEDFRELKFHFTPGDNAP